MSVDHNFGYVLAAYLAGALILGAMILATMLDYAALKRALKRFPQRGADAGRLEP
ncbi:heme exporter protein CcmD [Methylocella sp.]|uniref:heme exporter protein CcmD n=1 Tax=Methylocella sp. TaxID=1978226 RepID=UPI003784935A